MRILCLVSSILLLVSCTSASKKPVSETFSLPHSSIDHVIYLVFDAMRPDYIDRFDLTNFKRFRSLSQNYQEAYVGYLGSETVVSHLVFSTGLKPKDLPWQDDVFFDLHGSLGKSGEFYSTGGLSLEQFEKLLSTIPKAQFLSNSIRKKLGGSVFVIGEKNYASFVFGAPEADSIITLKKTNGICAPDGLNVPSYIKDSDRFKLECLESYGTENTFYALDGAHFVPGHDSSHLGGDIWTTDAALKVMQNENWSGLFLTFGAIDKVSHMLGEQDGKRPKETRRVKTDYTLSAIAKIADLQLGRVLDFLEKNQLMNRTLIIITADHGGHSNQHYLGNGKTAKWGSLKNENPKDEPKWVQHFAKPELVKFSLQDSAIRTWLKDGVSAAATIQAMSEIPGVTEIYQKRVSSSEFSYTEVFSRLPLQTKKFKTWAKAHSTELLDAMAASNSPDLVGLLQDNTGFDLIGDHGGAQENVQRIPLMIFNPTLKARIHSEPIRLYEVKAKIEESLPH